MLRADLNKLKLLQTFQVQQFDEMMRQAKERLVQQISRISQGMYWDFSYTEKMLMTVRVIITVYWAWQRSACGLNPWQLQYAVFFRM